MKTMLSGAKLKTAIKGADMSQAEFARRMNTSPQVVSNMINKGTRDVTVDNLKKMKALLGCQDKDLLVTVK